jgi:adenylyltransferase/sulfurtransferase
LLCRAGVGYLRLVDRDYVELTNLQRQVLFTEDDAVKQRPKSIAACEFLSRVNSKIVLEPVVAELSAGNIDQIFAGADLILDALDNWETRFLINEWCVKEGVAWIYAAALGSQGVTMNFLPNRNKPADDSANAVNASGIQKVYSPYPCLRCVIPENQAQTQHKTCATDGILGMTTGTIAAIQAAEAIKILVHSPDVREGLLTVDVWKNRYKNIRPDWNADCPVCVKGQYEYLYRNNKSRLLRLCGRNAIQITPESPTRINLSEFAANLARVGNVDVNEFILNFSNDDIKISLFQDGRAIIENAKDESHAKSIYTELIGL